MFTYTEKITSSAEAGFADWVGVETDTDPEDCLVFAIIVHDSTGETEATAWLTSSDVDLLCSALRTAQNRLLWTER